MDALVIVAALLVGSPGAYFLWSFLGTDRKAEDAIRNNLVRGKDLDAGETREGEGIFLRIGRRITPDAYIRKLDQMLSLAGRPPSIPLGRLLAAKPALGLAGALFGLFLSTAGSNPVLKLLGAVVFLFGYFIPDLLLLSKGQERQKKIQLELANTLDQMLISVEAGLGFEGAMARAGQNGTGPLAEELVRTLQDMQVGRSRRDSYLGLAQRTSAPELRSFVQAVVQADAYGIAISRVLRVQAKVMRVKRRQRAEEKAMKLPVMVLFPLLFFIFPVLFIAILGPTVIRAIAAFTGQ
ncbi:type II secretion system F family protein [Pseudarthrobacter phenanthrenivorans]|uniref:Type II secretion system F family protein n=1 Tax=Pseudarthrobacter phenanthrenivorans TaxID=361575 RepID=A0A3B0G050_PSEPS|nr:type II secretion system F family protein [Pseudarthrobacter phenanthrenivorans]RKO25560.1 type II secretion system F family protein [Pseudarthrobacter phenanthrenivorans]